MRGDDQDLFSNLPSDVIIDILTRLPTKTIRRCCSVCKVWLQLISKPEFANLRRLRPPPILMIFQKDQFSSCFNMVELENEPTSHDLYYLPGSKMALPKRFKRHFAMFGSINGLLCFQEYQLMTVHLWNPLTQEIISVPSPGGVVGYPNIFTTGFGLSSVNSHYKVVRIYQELNEGQGLTGRITKSECHVYTLGQARWRHRGHAPFMYSSLTHGIFLNSNLHWWITDPDGSEFISCFDIEKETFKPFPAPPGLEKSNLATLKVYKENYLSVCDNTSDYEITIWVMKEYGVEGSWVKEFVIDKHPIDLTGDYYEVVSIIKVFDDGEILLLWRDDIPISYNPKSNSVRFVELEKFTSNSEPFSIIQEVDYVPSFLSLKSFGTEMVEDAQVCWL